MLSQNNTAMSTNFDRERFSARIDEAKIKARRLFRRLMILLLVLGILSAIGYYVYRIYPKGQNEQTGTLFKLSYEGYLFKTHEGQLHIIGSAVLTTQSTWDFSIKDESVYKSMQPYVGKPVKLYYEELPETALPWQGKTKFIVYKAEPLN